MSDKDICSFCGVDQYMDEHKEDCARPLTPSPPPWSMSGDLYDKTITVSANRRDGRGEVAYVENDDCDPDESRANARLIAQAPVMLDLIRRLAKSKNPTASRREARIILAAMEGK